MAQRTGLMAAEDCLSRFPPPEAEADPRRIEIDPINPNHVPVEPEFGHRLPLPPREKGGLPALSNESPSRL